MSVELQINAAALAAAVARNFGQQLRSTCLPTFSGASIDHLDVVPGGATVVFDGSEVEVQVPADVFIVLDTDRDAAPNGTPAGATAPAGRASFLFRLQVTGPVLQLTPTTPDLGSLAALAALLGQDAGALGQQLVAIIPPVSVDLRPQLALLNLALVSTADIVLVGGVVAVRFDAAGAPVSQLFAGQQWGLFIDGAGVEALLRAKLAPAQATLPGSTLDVRWAPVGTTAHVDITLSGKLSFSVLGAHVEVDLPCDFSVLSGAAPVLRGTIESSIHVDESALLSLVLPESDAENLVEDAIDPSKFGATKVGDHGYVIDARLPAVPLLAVVLRYDSVLGSAAGMTIGGAVLIPNLNEPAFAIEVGPLTGPLRIENCSTLARAGSGNPSKAPLTLADTTSFGSVQITGCGELCAIELPPDEAEYGSFIHAPTGVALEDATVNVSLPYWLANQMTQPLTFVVRTPRGVRRIDLGMAPKAQLDPNGRLLNGRELFIPDCPTYVPGHGFNWGGDVSVLITPPLENPDWDVYLRRAGGVAVQLVRVSGLDASELLRFRSATHAIDVVADGHGRAVAPVLLPLSAALGAARLTRANGRSLQGHVGVSSASFQLHVSLPGQLSSGPELTPAGNVRIATRAGHRTSVHTVTALGPIEFGAAESNQTELNPQPLPPGPPPQRLRELAERAGIVGVSTVVFVPGFASSGAAVATRVDGTKLMLDVRHDGGVRITGTFEGPIGAIEVAGPWAVSTTRRETTVLRFSPAQQALASVREAETV